MVVAVLQRTRVMPPWKSDLDLHIFETAFQFVILVIQSQDWTVQINTFQLHMPVFQFNTLAMQNQDWTVRTDISVEMFWGGAQNQKLRLFCQSGAAILVGVACRPSPRLSIARLFPFVYIQLFGMGRVAA